MTTIRECDLCGCKLDDITFTNIKVDGGFMRERKHFHLDFCADCTMAFNAWVMDRKRVHHQLT